MPSTVPGTKSMHSFFHSFKKYLMSGKKLPGNALGAGAINTTDTNSCFHAAYRLLLSKLYAVLDGDDCCREGESREGSGDDVQFFFLFTLNFFLIININQSAIWLLVLLQFDVF